MIMFHYLFIIISNNYYLNFIHYIMIILIVNLHIVLELTRYYLYYYIYYLNVHPLWSQK